MNTNVVGLVLLVLLLATASYVYREKRLQTLKENLIQTLEKELNATYVERGYLDLKTLNSFKLFQNKITNIHSHGYFKSSDKTIEYICLKFIKVDSEGNDLVRVLFDGKVVITSEDFNHDKCTKREYIEAGELLNPPTSKCKIFYHDKYYYFYDNQKLFPSF